MKTLLLLLAALTLSAQTKLTLDQQRTTPAATERVIIAAPDGSMRPVELGSGLAIVGGKLTVNPAQDIAIVVAQVRLTVSLDGTYPASQPASTIYSRNGIIQTVGVDYQIVEGRIQPVVPWPAEDVVTAMTITAIPVRAVIPPRAAVPWACRPSEYPLLDWCSRAVDGG